LAAAAVATVVVADSKGRRITLQRPGVLAQFDIVKAAGPVDAKNETYMAMILPLIFVTDIDGERVDRPMNDIQIRAIITRLGEEGLQAVMEGVRKHYGNSDPGEDAAAIKK
jgi:hypothetical protein